MNTSKQTIIALFLTVFLTVMSSCSKNELVVPDGASQALSTTQMRQAMPSLANTKWTFSNYLVSKVPTNKQNISTLEFTTLNNGTISYSGKSFVNNYMGSFSLNETNGLVLKTSGSASTKMGGDNASMNLESNYLTNLDKVNAFSISGKQLIFYIGKQEGLIFTAN